MLKVHNPCVDNIMSFIKGPEDEKVSYEIGSPDLEVELSPIQFSSSLEICGEIKIKRVTKESDAIKYDS